MPRKGNVPKREVLPDPIYGNKVVTKLINNIIGELVEFNMTGYLRTKYDQAKNSLRKIEQIAYEVKIWK